MSTAVEVQDSTDVFGIEDSISPQLSNFKCQKHQRTREPHQSMNRSYRDPFELDSLQVPREDSDEGKNPEKLRQSQNYGNKNEISEVAGTYNFISFHLER
jgi:hypothetical protein